jgi:hypothetical protein
MSGVTSVYPDITGHIRPDVRRDLRDVPNITSGKNRGKTNISCDITDKTVISQLKTPQGSALKNGYIGYDIRCDIIVFSVISQFFL